MALCDVMLCAFVYTAGVYVSKNVLAASSGQMWAARSSKMSVYIKKATRRHIAENYNIYY
jgi:hypothetical protein